MQGLTGMGPVRSTRLIALGFAASAFLAACSGACPTPAPAGGAAGAGASAPTTGGVPSPTLPATASPTMAEPTAPTSTEPPTDAPPTDAPPSEPAALDPCALISKAEAEALVGGRLRKAMRAGQPPVMCMWPTPPSGAVRQVQVDIGDGVVKFLEIDRDVLGHAFKQPKGIGDEAWYEPGNVFFRVGEQWIGIHAIGLPAGAKGERRLLDLARTVASRV